MQGVKKISSIEYMKTSRFTDSQIMAILKQNEGWASVPDLCREPGISSPACISDELNLAAWTPHL